MEFSIEKSEEQGADLKTIIALLPGIDTDYLTEAAKSFKTQASRMDAAAALISAYDPDQSKLLRLKADALIHLSDFKASLLQAQDIETKVQGKKKQQEFINGLFGL